MKKSQQDSPGRNNVHYSAVNKLRVVKGRRDARGVGQGAGTVEKQPDARRQTAQPETSAVRRTGYLRTLRRRDHVIPYRKEREAPIRVLYL